MPRVDVSVVVAVVVVVVVLVVSVPFVLRVSGGGSLLLWVTIPVFVPLIWVVSEVAYFEDHPEESCAPAWFVGPVALQ